VFFHVDVGFGSADSALAVAEELRSRGAPLTMYWGVDDLSVPVPAWATPVVKFSEAWYAKLNASRYLVNNYGGVWGLTKDPAQRYLQTWHGTPLKYIGVSEARQNRAGEARFTNIAKEAGNWDAAVSPSPYFTRILASQFLFTGRVLEVGYPRTSGRRHCRSCKRRARTMDSRPHQEPFGAPTSIHGTVSVWLTPVAS
jgi:CDP-glycerol glycerophosphotransferase